MAESLRVLILEDRPEDAELMLRELRRAGYEPDWKCVAGEADFAACLPGDWDVILADYVLPEFNAAQALQQMREQGLDVPFILVTGSVGEEVAVECMQAGAADYVFKDRLARLGPAVQRALERKRARDERRQALAALRESEAKLRTVFHSSADLITIADMETGVYVDVNDGFLQMTGHARDEVIGKTGDDLHLWREPAQRREVVRRVSQGQEVRNEEVWFYKKDGTPFIGLLTAEKVEVSGRPCLLCVVRDITERKQMEAESEQRRLFLENVLACAPDAIAVLDAQARVVEWNAGAAALFGYTRDEAVGKDIDELIAGRDPALHKDAVGLTEQLLRGQPVTTSEMVRFRKDGTPITVIAAGAPIVMEGKTVGIVAVYTDITERKHMEEALRDSERRYHTLAEMSPVGIFRTDAQGKTTYVNPRWSQISGAEPQDALGNGWVQAVHPEDREKTLSGWREAVREGVVSPAEYRFLRPNGTVAWVMGLAVPEVDDQGNVVGYVGTITDITERKRMEEALRESEERFRRLFERMPSGVAVYQAVDNGADFVIKDFNAAAERIEGVRWEDVVGKRVTEAFPGVSDLGLLEVLRRVWKTGEDEFLPEAAYTDESGRRTWRENWVYRLPNGDVVALYNDITERKNAEEKIRESEETYRNLFQNAQVGLFRTRISDGKILESNEQLARMFGYDSREEFIQEYSTSQNYVDPGTRERMLELIRRDGYVQGFEARFYRKDRSIFWARYSARIYPDRGWIEGVAEDITDQKAAEEALRRRTRELTVLNQMGLALAETLDLPRIYDLARRFVAELVDAPAFGISLYDAETRTLRAEFMWNDGVALDVSQFPPLTMPEDTAQATRGRAKAILTAQPEVVESLPDAIAQAPGGARHVGPPGDTRRTLSAAYVPMVVEGKVIGLLEVQSYRVEAYTEEDIALLRPVANQVGLAIQNARLFRRLQEHAAELERSLAELKQAQEALRESEERFRSLVESMDDIVFTLDREGRHTGVFGRWLAKYGTPPEVYLGKTARDMMGPEAARVHEEANARALAGENVVYEWSAPGADGPLYFQTSLSPLYGPDGQVVGIVGVGRDITALKRAEKALRESEERYRLLAETATDAIFLHDMEGHILYANKAAQQMSGYSLEEILSMSLLDIVPEEYRGSVAERRQRRLAGNGSVNTYEVEFIAKSGKRVPVEASSAVMFRDGKSYGVLIIARDITERKQMENALRASEATLRSIFNAAPIGMGLVVNRTLLQVNKSLCDMLGYAPEELVGKSARVLYPSDEEFDRVGRDKYAQIHERGIGTVETQFRCKNGEVRDIWLSSAAIDLSDLSKGVTFTAMDITERKRTERALRESEERYRALVNLSPDGIWVHRHGEVLFTNEAAAAMFGAKSPEDLIGKQALDFVAPDMRDIVRERIRRSMEERLPAPLIEEKLLRLDGTEFYADVLAVPITWGGEPAVQVIIRDSTERKEMEERLLQAQKMEVVGRLAGGVAHDFNNILTAINGYATFALDALPRGDPVRADVEQILASAERASNLTRQLLAFSRRQIIEQRVVSLNDLILNLDKMLRRLIGEDIELVVIPGEDLSPVKADPGQIEQVIVNLAVNARDAMPNGGKLIIETANVSLDAEYAQRHPGAQVGDHVLLAVTDTGLGMTDEVKAHLFEPFFTTKEPGKGTGLGLATVYGIVKQHGGNIYAYSELGKGTTFKIYLPAVEAEAERLPRRDEEGYVPRGTETVLVVEDEANVRAIVTRTLTEQGYTVLEAADGYEALRLARDYEGEIHLLLTDVVMPQMGGKELSERFAAIRPGVKTLFMSGYTDNAIVHRGILDPGVAFLQKPFTAAALARRVRQALDRQ
ncbi:MAG: hypothetical protein Kow00123_11880 [Anaerolineales bacterium]